MTSGGLPKWLNHGLHLVIAIVFLVSGWSKAGHPAQLASHLQYRLDWFPSLLPWPTTLALAAIELLIGVMLATRFRADLARKIATILLGIFIAYLAVNLFFGIRLPCQCYGNLIEIHPILGIGLNIVLLGIIAILERRGSSGESWRSFAVGLFVVLALLGFTRFTAYLDPLLVRIQPGMSLPTLPSLHPAALNRDRQRLVLVTDQPLANLTTRQIQAAFPNDQLVILAAHAEPQGQPGITAQQPHHLAIKPELTSFLAKSFPTCFTLKNQKIETIWFGRLPEH